MNAEPQKEHQWLQQLVGAWTYETEAVMGPDQPPQKFNGTERVRSLGGLWIVAEGQGEMPGGGTAHMITTLGYDPQKRRFVGTWVGSMMTYLWVYDGALDAAQGVLTLDAEGPNMAPDVQGMARYQDIVELKPDGQRRMRSQVLGEDGKWTQFMTAVYRRTG